jgi:hypothetical protein
MNQIAYFTGVVGAEHEGHRTVEGDARGTGGGDEHPPA